MKSILIPLLVFISFHSISAQNISCSELSRVITKDYSRKEKVKPLMSSMLAKATWYEYEGMGFVIAYLKENDYDLNGSPYIFCGISNQRWTKFKNNGLFGSSYGKAFHKYIMEYTCNCN
jgi:hypothetical protein